MRADGEPASVSGKSSGLMSFLKIGDRSAGAIKSGGTTQRAAKMVRSAAKNKLRFGRILAMVVLALVGGPAWRRPWESAGAERAHQRSNDIIMLST